MKKLYPLFTVLALLLVLFGAGPAQPAQAAGDEYFSLRFYGHGSGQIDRVKIQIDDPHVPADVGGNFTMEFWMKAAAADNTSGACTGGGVNWINGNVIIDRDVYGDGDHGDYGISLYGGKIAFGVAQGAGSQTICSATNVTDNQWHHIAVTRNQTNGAMQIFIDGVLDASGTGPTGNISYRDGRPTDYPDSDPYLVFGAEKHDAGIEYPSYNGYLDEVRISNNIRYTEAFDRPIAPMTVDGNTVALYRFDEGLTAGSCTGGIVDEKGTSNGFCSFGGDAPAGPVYSTDVPPIYHPDLIITGYEFVDPITEVPIIGDPEPNKTFGIRVLVKNQGGTDPETVFYRSVFVNRDPMEPAMFEITEPDGCLYNLEEGENDWGDFRKEQINNQSIPPGMTDTETIVEITGGLPPGSHQIWLYADPLCAVQNEFSETNNAYGPITINGGYSITGNAGAPGVTLTYVDDSTKTVTSNNKGVYRIIVPAGWSGTVTPSKSGHAFVPKSRSYSNLDANVTGQTYNVRKVFRSTAAQDGWVLESTRTSNKGGSLNRGATTLRVGDDAANRQYRSILSFNTASLPDNAVITKVTLKIKRQGVTGSNPINTHGRLLVDIRRGPFSGNAALQLTDFQFTASKSNVGKIPKKLSSGWHVKTWTSGIFPHVNKKGVTQLRLRFAKQDDNDARADYLSLFSGNASAANRPQLIILYNYVK